MPLAPHRRRQGHDQQRGLDDEEEGVLEAEILIKKAIKIQDIPYAYYGQDLG